MGGVETPFLTILVLRHKGNEYQINHFTKWFVNKGSFGYFDWEFECETKDVAIKGRIKAPASAFVGLRYHNPSGGDKNCLNSKVATCELKIIEKSKLGMPQALYSENSCAFEILTNEGEEHHGIKINF